MNTRLISNFFGKLLFLPKPFFDSTSTGDMVARMNDVSRIQKVVVYLTSQIVIDVLVVFASSGYIFFYSISTGLLSLLSIPVFGLLAWRYNSKIIVAQRRVMHSYAATESKYIDTINGVKTIKTFNCENLFSKIVNNVYGFFMQKVYVLGLIGAKINLLLSVGGALLLTGIITWSAYLVLEEQLLLGQMMAIITIAGTLGTSVIGIAMANIQYHEARIAFGRMFEFSSANPEYVQVPDEENHTDGIGPGFSLSVRNLSFRFPGKKLLLNKINLDVKIGEIVSVFGEVGCGKSTLFDILLRFHEVEEGTVTINNQNWNSIETPVWRENVALVPQHVSLFNATIFENIALEEAPDPNKVVQFCKDYGFHKFIMELQQGYATVVNENSSNLSGGQRQLVALARALYKKPGLLLLDEATAAMDRRTEKFVVELIKKLKHEIAVVIVTHRPQLASLADTIYVIENNTIAISGNPGYVFQNNPLFRESFAEMPVLSAGD